MIRRKSILVKWLGTLALLSLFAALAVAPANAAPRRAPAVDGDGQVTVSPDVITYGSGTVTLTFTFSSPTSDFVSGSQVEIDVPTGWTTPTLSAGAGHLSWFADTCLLKDVAVGGKPPSSGTGTPIFIDLTACSTGSSFRVTYANVTPGSVAGSPHTFAVYTDIGSGGQGLVPTNAPAPTVSVDPKNLTVSSTGLTPANKVYNAGTSTTLTIGSPTLIGIVGSDSVTLVTTGATADFADQDVGNAKTVYISGLTLGGAKASNYTLTQPTRSANITPRPLIITAVTDTKTYDGGVSSSGVPNLTSGVLQGTDTANWTQTFSNKNAGTGKVLIPAGLVSDGHGGANYSYTYVNFTGGTINKLPITVTAETDSKTYDGNTSSAGIPLISPPLVGTDTSGFLEVFDNKNVGINKTLSVTGVVNDGNSGNNYSYTRITDTTGVITQKMLYVSAAGLTPANKVYDGTTAATLTTGTPSLIGVVSPDVVTLNAGSAVGTFADRNVGTGKTVNISGLTLGGAGASNYDLTQPTRLANITARPLTLTATSDTKTYDGTTNSVGIPSVTAGTLGTGDSAGVWTQSFNSKHAGTKTLIPAGLVNDGNSGNNYAYTYATASGTINKLSITVTAVTDSKAYDGNTSSVGVPLLSAGTPLAAGDIEPVWTQTFSNKNAGSGKTINPAGIVGDGNGGNNYAYNLVPNTNGSISIRAITVTAVTDTKSYDGTTASSAAPNITPDLVGTDTSAFIQTFDTATAGTNKTLTPSGTVNDGNSGLNYAITFAAPITTGIINPANATLTVTNPSVTYNGAAQAATVSSGSVAGTVLNIMYNGSATVPTNAGTYAITADFNPTDTTNYNALVGVSAGNFVIKKATPTVTLSVTNSPVLYTGAPKAAVVKISASSVPGTVSNIRYNGLTTAPTNAAKYTVTAAFIPTDSANYNSLATINAGSFIIQKERTTNGNFNTYPLNPPKPPTAWSAPNFIAPDGKDTRIFKEGGASVKVIGTAGKNKTLSQTINLSGVAGDLFTFSYWSRASALPTIGTCQAQVLFYYGTSATPVAAQKLPCPTSSTWTQAKATNFTVSKSYTKIVIQFTYNKASGTIWWDLVSLLK